MKKTRYPIVLLICGLALLISSCKKDHTCVCGYGVAGVSFTFHETASKAKKSCEAMEEDFKTNCKLE